MAIQLDSLLAKATSRSSIAGLQTAIGAMVALVPTILLGSAIFALHLAKPESPREAWHFYYLDTLVASPVIETAFMFPILGLLRKLKIRNPQLPLASAIIWGLFHGLLRASTHTVFLHGGAHFTLDALVVAPVFCNAATCQRAAKTEFIVMPQDELV